jgi:hypothetical protein
VVGTIHQADASTPCVALNEKIMTEPRNSEHRTKIHQQDRSYGVARAGGSAAVALAGRTAYREEFQCDHGPDLDESLDGIESAHEF